MQQLWVRLPVDLIGEVSYGALTLLSLLMNMDMGSQDVQVQLSYLAAQMRCSDRHIRNYLSELEKAGLILSRHKTRTASRITLKPDILPPRIRYPKQTQSAPQPKPQPSAPSQPQQESSIDPELLTLLMQPH